MTVFVAKVPVKSHSDFSNSILKIRCNMSFYSSLSVLVGTSKVMMIVKKNKQIGHRTCKCTFSHLLLILFIENAWK